MTESVPGTNESSEAGKAPKGYTSKRMQDVMQAVQDIEADEKIKNDLIEDNLVGSVLRQFGRGDGFNTITRGFVNEGREDVPTTSGQVGNWYSFISRARGVRRAVLDVSDAKPGSVKNASGKLRLNNAGMPVMVTFDQIDGYLMTETDQELDLPGADYASNWKNILRESFQDYLETQPNVTPVWDLTQNPTPGIDPVRQQQNNWQRAAETARSAGVDVELLLDSVRYMKENKEDPYIGPSISTTSSLAVLKSYEV